ncbi:MAG: hypothetical protein WD396_09845 [Pseudohongiellaceae bacterium]
MALQQLNYVITRLRWMEEREIWPNGLRYLWTDAFGLVLYVSLYRATGDAIWLSRSQTLVDAVYRVLGRKRGLRIGEEPDRDGQYFHYLSKWIYALMLYGEYAPGYRDEAIRLAKQIHPQFVVPSRGVIWKMREDLSAPYPGFGYGALDAFDGYVVYRLLDEDGLAREIAEMEALILESYRWLYIDQDLGLGMMLWLCHFFPDEPWATRLNQTCTQSLETLWTDKPGYFCRQQGWHDRKFAFTNYGVSLGLQAQDLWPERVTQLNGFFEDYRSGDEYDSNAITHVMACASHFPGLFLRNGGNPTTARPAPIPARQ